MIKSSFGIIGQVIIGSDLAFLMQCDEYKSMGDWY